MIDSVVRGKHAGKKGAAFGTRISQVQTLLHRPITEHIASAATSHVPIQILFLLNGRLLSEAVVQMSECAYRQTTASGRTRPNV